MNSRTCPVGVVILSYNEEKLLVECLKSIAAQRVYPQEILVVDNGSRDFAESAVRMALPDAIRSKIRFLALEKNHGYAKGMNRGLERLLEDRSLEWLMTLNQDTRLDSSFFEELSGKTFTAKIGMLSPKVLSMKNPSTLDGAGIVMSLDGMSTARGQREKDERQYDRETGIMIPNGVAALYRAPMLREVGLFDEDFWSYCEDTDLGLRAWLAGWECRFLAECRVLHKRSTTLGEHSLKKLYFTERNHFWVALKNFPLPLVALNPAFTLYRYAMQLYAVAAKKGQGEGFASHSKMELASVTLQALRDAFAESGHMFRKRKAGIVKRSRAEILVAILGKKLSFKDLILK